MRFLESTKAYLETVGLKRALLRSKYVNSIQQTFFPHTPTDVSRRELLKVIGRGSLGVMVVGGAGYLLIKNHHSDGSDREENTTGSSLLTNEKLTKEHLLTFEKGDTARRLLQDLYNKLDIDKIMEEIYPDAYIKQQEGNETIKNDLLATIRFNIFFIAIQSELYFMQEKEQDIFTGYKVGDTLTIVPANILGVITADPDIRREERKLRLLAATETRTSSVSKAKKSAKKPARSKDKPSQPSITEIREEINAESGDKKTKTTSSSSGTVKKLTEDEIERPSGKEGQQKRKEYIKEYQHLARTEMQKYNIPASIKLAQAIVESRHGESGLTKETNNHFCIKCRTHTNEAKEEANEAKKANITTTPKKAYYINSKKCCFNHDDDNSYDMFKVYDNPKASYRHHSSLLAGSSRFVFLTGNSDNEEERSNHFKKIYGKKEKPYLKKQRELAFQHRDTPYKKRAHGLAAMGYATDPTYASKLIRLIEERNLTQFDVL